MSHKLYELDVRLQEIEPPIWRTIEVPGELSLEGVHLAIQIAMGWTNSHLHQFTIGGKRYGMIDPDGEDAGLEDDRAYRLQDLVKERASFTYEYDFGDGWEHRITVVKVTAGKVQQPPRCTAGARACPPEDCGGAGGYASLLDALADPKHPEHADMTTWSSGFEPERFALPARGLDLLAEMTRLKQLADGDDEDELNLPESLVETVLALDPLQRASLAALIAGSLANELLDATEQLAKKRDKQLHRTRRRR